ncbi:hypothetical protein CR513_48773, partial [Mucuna pruriens]
MNCGRVDNPTFLISTLSDDNLGNFDPKYDKGIFIRYSTTSKSYKVNNSRTLKVEEFIHIASKEPLLDDEPKTDKAETSSRN